MSTKTSDLLGGIPSVTDLLDKPPIRALADRWNRSVIAAGVRSFLDELRSDLQRRAAEAQFPSIRELAERAARHVVALNQNAMRPAINATGRIHGAPWIATPLGEPALERVFGLGRDFVAGPRTTTGTSLATSADMTSLLCQITQAQSAKVVHSYAGAVWLSLAALANNAQVIVGRAELGDIEPGLSLLQLASAAGCKLTEVGTTNRTIAADYEAAITPQTSALLKFSPDAYRVVGETTSVEFDEMVGLARDRELTLIDALGMTSLIDRPEVPYGDRRTAQASLAAGADLVIARGDAFVGGPPCGVIVGSRELIAQIDDHPLGTAWQLDALRSAALVATLERYSNPTPGDSLHPVQQLLETPLENLRDRAQRLAPQLAQAAGIASAVAVAICSPLSLAGTPGRGLPSFGVVLTAERDVRDIEQRLLAAPHPVVGRREGEQIILDLRTVFPRQDQVIVGALAGSLAPTPSTASDVSAE